MLTSPLSKVLEHLRRTALRQNVADLGDMELLEGFLNARDEAAFEALVRRHGPMVLGVCRRILKNSHDAEDAFQATFLVLVRKGASIRKRETVGGWLYGVAYKTALKARSADATRQFKEREARAMGDRQSRGQDAWLELQPLLDQELSRLPDKYRLPIVLCHLEGKSHKEAARQLDCAEGTLSSWLSRGRALLAKRLSRHSLTVTGAVLAAAASEKVAAAAVPVSLLSSTVKAATSVAAGSAATGLISAKVAALTEGVLKAMLLTKLKIATVLLLVVGILGVSLGGLTPMAVVQAGSGKKADKAQLLPVRDKQDRKKANVDGKYSDLLEKIKVPQDRQQYGDFYDYGYWEGTEYAGFENLPSGYWVYAQPYWYIWGKKKEDKGAPAKASVNGKYSRLLKKLKVPQDRQAYGDFNDFGHWTGTSYAGFDDLPPGHWVYVQPYWYIWGRVHGGKKAPNQENIIGGKKALKKENLKDKEALKKASVNGKYGRLLKKIKVEEDRKTYTDFHECYWDGDSWAGHDNLPAGHWVYVAPYWYIWRDGPQDQ
jgi:RNA polymerase sigma factor (sigma-70 family)